MESVLVLLPNVVRCGGRGSVEETQPEPTTNLDDEAGSSVEPAEKNGTTKILKRLETVPDIKRDTSGITKQFIAAGIVNLGAFASGVCVAWSSSALPMLTSSQNDMFQMDGFISNSTYSRQVDRRHELTELEASWVASLLCLGAVFGAVPAGLISEYFGRKKTLLYLALPLLVSWILVASSPNVYGLYVGRFVGGVAVGAFSVGIPPYVEDIAEKHLLPTMANFYHVHFACGVLFGYIIGVLFYVEDVAEKHLLPTMANFYHVHFACGVLFGYIIGMVQSTTWLSVLSASIPVGFFAAFIFLPESPGYLMSQGKANEAKAALRYFRGIDNDVDSEIKALKEHIRSSVKNRVTFKELFKTRATFKALFVTFILMIFQQLSGIFPVLFYAETIFKTFKISLIPPGPAIILGFCLVSSTYFSTMLLKKIRRRVLLLTSFATMAISLGSLAIYYHLMAANVHTKDTWVPLLTLCLFVIVYAMGAGPIPWLMLREIFPRNVTRRATAITAGFHWFLAFSVTKLYQNLVDIVSYGWALWFFSVTCVLALIFIYFFVPETKGRTLSEIQDEFEGIHKGKTHRHFIEVETVVEV